MDLHMAHIIFNEKRPCYFGDFRRFEVGGKEYRMSHGTFRNEISKRVKSGKVEMDYNCGTAYYTIAGHKFGKRDLMTHGRGDVIFRRITCRAPDSTI